MIFIWRNKEYLSMARGKPCVRCGVADGTVVACHYSGKFSDQLGKGKGIKASDIAVAFLCSECHNYFDSYENNNDYERAAEFMVLCFKTISMLLDTGEIRI